MSEDTVDTAGGKIGTHPALDEIPIVFSDTVDVVFENVPTGWTKNARAFTIAAPGGTLAYHNIYGKLRTKTVVTDKEYVLAVRRFLVAGTTGGMAGTMKN